MKRPVHLVLAACFLGTAAFAEVRTFTSSAGTTLNGELVSVIGDTVTLKKEDGTPLTLKLAAFSRVDQAWLQTQASSAADPAKATKDAPFVNSLGMKFVPVPGTTVLMCVHETRRKDYGAYCFGNKVNMEWKSVKYKGHPIGTSDAHPVSQVSWNDAHDFCAWLGKKEQRTYRLPTDREWSLAVGIGERETAGASPEDLNRKITDHYPWGSATQIPAGAGNYCDTSNQNVFHSKPYDNAPIGAGYTDGFIMTSPVMSFSPNNLGIYDLGGNVWELVEDTFSPATQDITFRGSSYTDNSMKNALSSSRVPLPKDARTEHAGFRIVLEQPAP